MTARRTYGARGTRTPKARRPAAFKAAALPLGERSGDAVRITNDRGNVKWLRRGNLIDGI